MNNKKNQQGHIDYTAFLCPSEALSIGGLGVSFKITNTKGTWPAFVVRHREGIAAYVNRCSHLNLELDWNPGNFFDSNPQYLICSSHGAIYSVDTGECAGGPCHGIGLESLGVVEEKGSVYFRDQGYNLYESNRKTKD